MTIELFEKKELGRIRTIKEDEEIWFVASDISNILEYSKVANMLDKVENEDRKTILKKTMPVGTEAFQNELFENQGSIQLVNESGFYTILLRSNKPVAKPFKRWVTAEVLPQIRKTGSYTKPKTALEIIEEAMELAHKEVEKERKAKERALVIMDKAKVIETVKTDLDSVITTETFSKLISDKFGIMCGRSTVYQILREMGMVMRDSTNPTQRGLLVYLSFRRTERGNYQTMVFQNKADKLAKLMLKYLSLNPIINEALGNPFDI